MLYQVSYQASLLFKKSHGYVMKTLKCPYYDARKVKKRFRFLKICI